MPKELDSKEPNVVSWPRQLANEDGQHAVLFQNYLGIKLESRTKNST